MMIIIRDNTLYDTDDYEEIQEAYEGYLYGSHRGLDIDEKEWEEDGRKIGRLVKNRKNDTYDY